jgi:predicted PurR-regulated permease PerM
MACILGLFVAIYFLKGALTPLILAWLGAYLLQPCRQWIEKRGASEKTALWTVYLGTLLILGLVFLVLVPRLIFEGILLVQHLPMILSSIFDQIQSFVLNLKIPGLRETHLRQLLQKQIETVSLSTMIDLSGIMETIGNQILDIAVSIANYTLFPVFFYYILRHFKELKPFCLSWIPRSWTPPIMNVFTISDHVFSGYVRGQITVSCILAILYAIGLSIVGLKYGVVIGIATGLLNIVPYFGFSIGILSGGLIALFSGHGILHLILVLSVFFVIQLIESFFLTPRIVGNNVGLSPFIAILALIIGGNSLGIFGMVIAIPLAAILKIFYDKWLTKGAT